MTARSITFIQDFLLRLPNISSAVLIFNDQPSNDFNSLSKTIERKATLLSQNDKISVFTYMVPKSFFEQVAAPASVDVGICMSSLHWLIPDEDGIGYRYLPRGPAAERSAHQRLVSFLRCRSQEIRPGGSLVLGIAGKGEVQFETPLEAMSLAIDDLEKIGQIPTSVAKTCRGPVYFRTEKEILRSVQDEGNWAVAQKYDKEIFESPQNSLDSGVKNEQKLEAKREELARRVCSTMLGSAGNTILTAVREQSTSSGVIFDEAELLSALAERFMYHFDQIVSCKDKIGGHWYYLRLERL